MRGATRPPAPGDRSRGAGGRAKAREKAGQAKAGASQAAVVIEPFLIGAPAAAELLGISLRLLWSWSASGRMPSVRIGNRRLYSPARLREWVEDQEGKGRRR